MIDFMEFSKLVYQVRQAQKAYYAKRIPARLIAAKQLECDLDRTLDEIRGQSMISWPSATSDHNPTIEAAASSG